MKKKVAMVVCCILLVIITVVPVGCTKTYKITLTTDGSGTVSGAESSFKSGDTAHLVATPANGWQFTGWSGDATGTDSAIDITVNTNVAITASFFEGYRVTLKADGSGTVTGGGVFAPGSITHLVATPMEGWTFYMWVGDVDESRNNLDVMVNSDLSITAQFVQLQNPDIPRITVKQLREWMNTPVTEYFNGIPIHEVLIIDSRDAGSFDTGHIPRATNFEYSASGNPTDIQTKIGGMQSVLTFYHYVVIYCNCADESGSSTLARLILDSGEGFTKENTFLLAGGLLAWTDAGLRIATGDYTTDADNAPV